MAVNIELKRSAVPGKVPTTGSINLGELAINTYDGKVYFKKDDGVQSIIELASTSGSILSASYATSASFATTASYSNTSTSASYALSASYASNTTSASYALFATSASYAATASSADDFLVRGTLTAQTIVAQTITSSTDFVTGSTRFGTQLTDTHQFTGSVTITGSLAVNGSDYTTTSASFNTRILNNSSSISYLSGSFLSASASFDTRITNNSASISYLSGSYLASSASFDTRITNNSASISYLSSSYLASSASFDTRILNNSASISYLSSSYLASSASFDTRITNNSASISYLSSSYLVSSASFDTRITNNSSSISYLSSSYLASSSSFDTRITNNSASISYLSSSYLASSASFDTRITNNSSSISYLSSSYLVSSASFDTRITNNSASISYLSSSYLVSSASFDTRITNNSASISALSQSFSAFTASYNTGSFIGQFTGSFSGSLNNLQGSPTYIPFFSSSQILSNSSMYQIGSASIAINQTNITTANPEALFVSQTHPTSINVISGKGNLNNYLQLNIFNTNQGVSASSDIVATANNGDEFSNYINMGINSELYSQNFIGAANDAYLYSIANDLHIGNAATNGTGLIFFVGGSDVNQVNKLQLNPNNQHLMSGSLDVSGSIKAFSFTGSLFGTASFADYSTSASYALTASYSNNSTSASYALTASYLPNAIVFPYVGDATIIGNLTVTGSTISTSGFTGSLLGTASFANNATSASYALSSSFASTASFVQNAVSASFTTTASFASSGAGTFSGSFSGSFQGNGSGLTNISASSVVGLNLSQISSGSATASISPTAGFVVNTNTTITGSTVISGSLTVTGSTNLFGGTGNVFSANVDTMVFTGSLFQSGSIVVTGSVSATNFTGSLFGTSSFANNATSASYAMSASFASTASFVQNAQSASYVLNAVSASFASTASYVLNAVSSSFAATASSADNFTVRGTLTAQTIVAQTITASTEVVTGSTKFGTLLSNTHQFTGSVTITGSLGINGVDYATTSASFDTRITNNSASISTLSSSFLNASASFDTRITNNSSSIAALSSSFLNASASFDTRITNNSASIAALSASFLIFSGSYNTGSFTGSFTGSLQGTASWALNAITASYAFNATSASYAATASSALNASDILVYVKNSSGAQIDKGKVVRIVGAVGDNPLIATASYTDDNNSANTLGITNQDIPNDDFGYVMTEGKLLGVDTSAYIAGQLIYLGATGSITGSAPVAPLHAVRLGEVLRVQVNNGSIYVRIDNGYELGELHDVRDTTTTGSYGDLLVKSGSIWINSKQLTGSYGLTGSLNTSGSNTFIGNQIVTGSLFTTGSNTLIGTTTLTGSLNITGSTTQVGNNTLLGNTLLSGSITISGSSGPGATTASVQIYGDIRQSGYHRFDPVLTNIDQSISASYIYVSGSTNDLYFSQNGNGYNNTTRLRWLEGNLYTGLLNGGLITSQSSTVYQVASGSGIVVNLNASLNDNPYPTVTYVNWPNLTGNINQFSASYDQTFVAISSAGTLISQSSAFLNGQIDTQIPVGSVLHQNNSTINGTVTEPSLGYGWKQRSNIFINAFGPLKLSGFNLAVSGSSTGSLIVGSGTAFLDGGNYQTDPNNPSYVTATGTNVSRIFRYYESGSGWTYDTNGGVGYGAIDPSKYSNNGTLTSVGAGNWSIQRVFFFPTSPLSPKPIIVYYGNAIYPTEAEAIANVPFEPFTEAPSTAATAIYLGAIVISGNGLFTSPATFTIYPGGLFRQVGGSGGGGSIVTQTLSGLSDVLISGPTDGQALVYNTTSAKWENKSFISASISGNAATATSASYASTASFVQNAVSASFASTASYVLNAVSSSFATKAVTASYADNFTVAGTLTAQTIVVQTITASTEVVTGSTKFGTLSSNTHQFTGSVTISGSLNVNGPATLNNLTGSLFGTSSFANNATSASFATTASYVLNAVSASFATSASYWSGSILNATSASFASTASFVQNAQSASYVLNAVSASFASTASYVLNAVSASFASNAALLNNTGSSVFATTGSNTFRASQTIDGNLFLSGSNRLIYNNNVSSSLLFGFFDGGSIYGPYFQIFGNQYADLTQRGSSEIVYDTRNGGGSGFNVASFDGSTWVRRFRVDNNGAQVTGSFTVITGSAIELQVTNTGVKIGNAITDTHTVTGSLNVSGSVTATNFTGSLFGTSSWANNVITASYVLQAVSASFATTASYVLQAVSASFASTAVSASFATQAANATTASYVLQAVSASFASTASSVNTLNQNVLITGSLTVGANALGAAENTLTLGPRGAGEGGQLLLQAPGAGFTSASMLDNYQDRFRILRGSNAGSDAEIANFNMHTGLVQFNRYTGSGAFVGTTAAFLAVDTNGVLLTSNLIPSASFATTASFVTSAASATSASFASTASYVLNAISSSFASTASFVQNAQSASYVLQAVSASFATSASNAQTASYVLNAVSASFASTASYVLNAVSSSFAATASSADNFTVRGTLTAQTIVAQTITSSTDFVTGSTRFGSLLSNTHQFTGSVSITGSLAASLTNVNQNNVVGYNTTTGQLFYQSTSSLSVTSASYALNATSASYAATASHASSGFTIGISQFQTATVASSIVGANNLFTTPTSSFTGAKYLYTVSSGSNARVGEVFAVWNGGTAQFTDVSTLDIGSTTAVTASVTIVTAQAQLNFQTNTSGWTIKSQATFI